jgi:polar amino acid transport system substrate-binding protein
MHKDRIRRLILAMLLIAPCMAFPQAKLVMVTEEWPPFRMNNAQAISGFVGIDIDLMARLEKLLGVPIEIQRHPWARALEMMKLGQADLITGIAYTEERALFIKYAPTPYLEVSPVFFARKGNGAGVRTYDDLYGKSIGFSTNSFYFEPFNSDDRLRKVGLSTEVQILQMLALGRLDLAIGTDPNISWDIGRLGYRDALEMTVYKPPVKTELYLGMSLRSPSVHLVPAIDEAIRRMKADGTIAAIAAKYR